MDIKYMTDAEKVEWQTSSSNAQTNDENPYFTTGSVVFCTDTNKLWVYNGTAWKGTVLE